MDERKPTKRSKKWVTQMKKKARRQTKSMEDRRSMTDADMQAEADRLPMTVSRQRYKSARSMRQTQRMMNDLRRRRTLARASIPKSKYSDGHEVEVLGSERTSGRSAHSSTPAPQKDDPVSDADRRLREYERMLGEATTMEERAEIEERRDMFNYNYSVYMMEYQQALMDADAMDRDLEEEETRKRDERRRLREERRQMREEDDTARFEDIEMGATGASAGAGASSSSSTGRTPPLTDFFARTKGRVRSATERHYRLFYHDHVTDDSGVVQTPDFKSTPVYTEFAPQEKDPSTAFIGSNDFNCPACGELNTLVQDDKTGFMACTACGIIHNGEMRYSQSFSEAQASSIKTNAPYERISHVRLLWCTRHTTRRLTPPRHWRCQRDHGCARRH